MDKNQQPSVTQELGRLFPSIRGGGRRGESNELIRVDAGKSPVSATDTNNTSFAVRSTTKWTIEKILGSKATSKKPRKPMSHKTTSGKSPSKFSIFFCVKPSDFRFVTWSMSFLNFDLPRLQFEVFQTKRELFWAIPVSSKRNIKTSNSYWNHVLNYPWENGLGTK